MLNGRCQQAPPRPQKIARLLNGRFRQNQFRANGGLPQRVDPGVQLVQRGFCYLEAYRQRHPTVARLNGNGGTAVALRAGALRH